MPFVSSMLPSAPSAPAPASLAACALVTLNVTVIHTWLSSLPAQVRVPIVGPNGVFNASDAPWLPVPPAAC
jgi:hypothetical protein